MAAPTGSPTDACGAAQVGGIGYELTMPDGSVRTGTAGPDGVIKLTQLTLRGDCKIVFRSIDDQTKGFA